MTGVFDAHATRLPRRTSVQGPRHTLHRGQALHKGPGVCKAHNPGHARLAKCTSVQGPKRTTQATRVQSAQPTPKTTTHATAPAQAHECGGLRRLPSAQTAAPARRTPHRACPSARGRAEPRRPQAPRHGSSQVVDIDQCWSTLRGAHPPTQGLGTGPFRRGI